MDADELALWAKRKTNEGRNAIYRRYEASINRIVENLLYKFCLPKGCDEDSIRQAGHVGALEAIRRFEPERDLKFETYATLRIRGSMLDEMRNQDPLPRLIRRMVIERITAEQVLLESGVEPTAERVCEKLKWDLKTYLMSTSRAQASLDHIAATRRRENRQDTVADIVYSFECKDVDAAFRDMCRGLSIEQQTLIYLYYWRGCTMKFIGEALGISESRVSQLHSQLMAELHKRGQEYFTTSLSA